MNQTERRLRRGKPQWRGLLGHVVEVLAKRIVTGSLLPGGVLDPEQLVREFDVSRTVVREALNVLKAKGLVDARPLVGTFVRPREDWALLDTDILRWRFETDETGAFLDELAELRKLIEPGAAALAAVRRTEEDIAGLERAVAEMTAAGRDGQAFIPADLRFHRHLLLATKNELLVPMEAVIETGLLIRDRLVHGIAEWRDSLPHHASVVSAVRDGNPEMAREAMLALLEESAGDLEVARRKSREMAVPHQGDPLLMSQATPNSIGADGDGFYHP